MSDLPWSASASTWSESRERLQRHIDAARTCENAADDEWVVVDVEAPVAEADAVLQAFPDEDAVLWSPPRGPEYAGLGIAQSIEGRAGARFDEVRERSHALWRRLRALGTGPASAELGPRLFGGFAFSADGTRAEPWRDFGDARFVLPRVLYARDQHRALLSLVVQRAELRSGSAHEHVRLFQRVQDALAHGVVAKPVEAATQPVERTGIPASAFRERIAALLELIRAGEVRKVVTAQELLLRFVSALDPIATAIALRDEAPGCVRFVFRWAQAAFVGATPERLLYKHGLELTTEALAGTIAAGADSENRLQGSQKELEEHRYVVSSITRALEPLCAQCHVASAPEIRRLKHLLHLRTPISAELRASTHVLELLERLHPTPAVGGVPTERAVEWIRQHEAFDRGWYAGAVGWFDASGDGDFNVALRSGLLSGCEARLFAGGGIVKDSVPQDEYEETHLKLTALLAALRSSPR
jgi:menaquinone-specific isochorismate synthase